MRRLLLLTLAMVLAWGVAFAQSMDVTAMTDDELRAMRDAIQAEIDRRAAEARAAAALRESDEEGEIVYTKEEKGTPKIIFASWEQLRNRLHKVPLTLDNWQQYLGDYYYPYTHVQTNNFGEVTREMEDRSVGFHFREGYIAQYENVGFKFTGKRTYRMKGEWNEDNSHFRFVSDEWKEHQQEYVFDMYSDGLENTHLQDYDCTAVTGTIYALEVTPEASRWILESKGAIPWLKIYVGDEYVAETDGLRQLYNKLNP